MSELISRRAQEADFVRTTLLPAYASGTLDPALSLLVETQAAIREDMSLDLRLAEGLAGVMFDQTQPAAMTGSVNDCFARIDALERSEQVRKRARAAARAANSALNEVLALPYPIREPALLAIGKRGWQFAGPGFRSLVLDCPSSAGVELMRIEPGAAAPTHDHTDMELTLILAGGFSDETGAYEPGDIAFARPGVVHAPRADLDGVCIALAVTAGPPVFRGALGLLRKLLGR